jgi:hypothetical protein
MRNSHAMLLGLFVGAGALITGCGGAGSDGSPVGSSQARLVFASKGTQPATLHVTATDDATGAVAFDKTVELGGNSASEVDLTLVPSSYTFAVDVLGGASGDATLGSKSAEVDLTDGETTQITLAAQIDAEGGSNGSAQVQIGVDVAPTIEGVNVQLTGGSSADATVQIDVDATDAGGGALSFFWSGAGLAGAVQGSSSLSIPASAVAAAAAGATSPMVHVVVQDAQGATAQADIAHTLAAGAVQGTTTSASGASAAAEACVQAQAQCNASCSPALGLGATGVQVNASCVAGCGLSFASCEAL